MSLPPCIVDLTLARDGRPRRRLWLPVFVLWPLLALLGLVALAVALLVDAVLIASGRPGWRWTSLVAWSLAAVLEARGLQLSVKGEHNLVNLVIK